jgi:hypothetical protein
MAQNTITAGDAVSPIAFAGGDDGGFVIKTGAAGSKVSALVISAAGVVQQLPQSMVRVNTANGYGSTNTMIRRYSTVVTNQGSDIAYADSATLGSSFTINTGGVYAISISSVSTASAYLGLSLNSSQLTTAIHSITAADRLCYGILPSTGSLTVSTCLYLPSGSVIRPHTDAGFTGGAGDQFTIVRVA